MGFLYCDPCVFVIGKEYEILILVNKNGIISICIDGKKYYEDNTGVLSSEKNFAKIRVPQSELDNAKAYTVGYRMTINRKGYFSEFGDEQTKTYSFKPLLKTDDINLYHIADVHYRFELAKKTSTYFGNDLDALLVNGDIGEVETEENYREVGKFVGDLTRGGLPTVFVRGNHDTRGHLAELYTEYFPAEGKKTYFTFELGPLHGVAFDCGEDKDDSHAEYGGVNAFAPFRQRETDFFKNLERSDKLTFAIGHIPLPRPNEGEAFMIEDDTYRVWNTELERINIAFMICGHLHRAFLLKKNDRRCLRPHDYPIIVGAERQKEDLWGTAMTISGNTLTVKFTDCEHKVRENHTITLTTGEIDI